MFKPTLDTRDTKRSTQAQVQQPPIRGTLWSKTPVQYTDLPVRIFLTVSCKAADSRTDLVEPKVFDISSLHSERKQSYPFSHIEEESMNLLLSHGYGNAVRPTSWEFKIKAACKSTDQYEIPAINFSIGASMVNLRRFRGLGDYAERVAAYKEAVYSDFFDHCLCRLRQCREAVLRALLSNARYHGVVRHGSEQCQSVGCSGSVSGADYNVDVYAELVVTFPFQTEREVVAVQRLRRQQLYEQRRHELPELIITLS